MPKWENIIPNTDCGLRSLTPLVKLRHRITPVIEYSITPIRRKTTVSYFPFHLSNRILDCVRTEILNIKRLWLVTIRFGPHIAGAPKCASRTPETLPCAVPRVEAPPRGVFAWCGAPRWCPAGPRKRGALGEGPAARPPLRPADDFIFSYNIRQHYDIIYFYDRR